MKSKEKLIIFDLDGVLINSLPNMKYALANTANQINQKISFEKYKKYIGLPFEKILRELNIKGDYNKIKNLYSTYSLKKISKLKIDKKKLQGLKKLKKKYFLAIFTSKDKIRTLKILKKYNIFSIIITSDDVKHGKPNPEGLIKILNKTRIKKRDAYFIGDTIFDYKAGKAAKINYLHASWGMEKKLKLKNVSYLNSIAKIGRILEA